MKSPKDPYIPKEVKKLIQPPQIPDDTMREMANFFMKTSVPRIAERAGIKITNNK